jgi:hypothetical protein
MLRSTKRTIGQALREHVNGGQFRWLKHLGRLEINGARKERRADAQPHLSKLRHAACESAR